MDQCIQTQITDPKFYVGETESLVPTIGHKLAEAYNWPEKKIASMNYIDFYLLADAYVAEKFEG